MNLANKLIRIGESESAGNQSLMQIITSLGLTTGLKLCLDAGDSASYNPSVQTDKWLDTSGNGCDFFRGSGTGSDSADPTFNGTAGGLSTNEYFSFDGADYFTYDSANETWMNSLHKDGAVFSILAVAYVVNTVTVTRLFSTTNGVDGLMFGLNNTGKAAYIAYNASGSGTIVASADSVTGNGFNVISASLSENGGANNSTIKVNGFAATVSTHSYASPSSNNPSLSAKIGALTNGTNPIPSGTRLVCLAIWEGVALTSTQLTDIYNQIKGRFGL